MPWHVEHGGGTCNASEWAVIKDSDGSTAGCHPTQEAAQAQVAALYANEGNMAGASTDEQRRAAGEKRRAALMERFGGDIQQARSAHPRLAEDSPVGRVRSQVRADGREVKDRYLAFPSEIRAETVEKDGKSFYRVEGLASVYEAPYEMWDMFGPYTETVSTGAGDVSLAAKPDVVFLVNHRGLSLARTGGPWNGNSSTLELPVNPAGLHDIAWLNPERSEVKDLMLAIGDKVVTEQSFGFMIDEGQWNEDFTEFRIDKFNINRGDVSAVNYGANPATWIAARQQEILTELRLGPPALVRAAVATIQQRGDLDMDEWFSRFDELRQIEKQEEMAEAAKGRSLAQIEAQLLDD